MYILPFFGVFDDGWWLVMKGRMEKKGQ